MCIRNTRQALVSDTTPLGEQAKDGRRRTPRPRSVGARRGEHSTRRCCTVALHRPPRTVAAGTSVHTTARERCAALIFWLLGAARRVDAERSARPRPPPCLQPTPYISDPTQASTVRCKRRWNDLVLLRADALAPHTYTGKDARFSDQVRVVQLCSRTKLAHSSRNIGAQDADTTPRYPSAGPADGSRQGKVPHVRAVPGEQAGAGAQAPVPVPAAGSVCSGTAPLKRVHPRFAAVAQRVGGVLLGVRCVYPVCILTTHRVSVVRAMRPRSRAPRTSRGRPSRRRPGRGPLVFPVVKPGGLPAPCPPLVPRDAAAARRRPATCPH